MSVYRRSLIRLYEVTLTFSVYDEKEFKMNVVVLVGRLVRDPEIRYTNSQMAVCTATLAVDRPPSRSDRENGNDRQADFIRITLFGKQAETFSRFLTKGRQVAVEGSIRTGSYQNQKGDTVYTTDVNVNRFDFVGSKNDNQGSTFNRPQGADGMGAEPYSASDIPDGFEAIDDDDIPF
jgi:single-strand DNA-binding protein